VTPKCAAVLTPLLPAGPLSREDQAAATQTTNAKVLYEFRTYLYRAGLSTQVVEREIAAVEDLANSYLTGQAEPRSLRAINQSDLAIYLSGTPSTAFTSFKRFVKFMAETGRMNWGEADEITRWLRAQKQT